MSLTSVWAKWEKWNSAFRTLFPQVKFCSPLGDHLKWYIGKGHLAVLPRRHALGPCETKRPHGSGEPADGKSLLAARARLNAVPNGIVGGNIHGWNMVKLLALVGMTPWKAYQGCLRIRFWTHELARREHIRLSDYARTEHCLHICSAQGMKCKAWNRE